MKDIKQSLPSSCAKNVLGRVLDEWSEGSGRSKTLEGLSRLVYEREPVDVATFVTSKDYLNTPTFWPVWLKDLEEFFQQEHWLAILRGAIGSGKTTFADVALAYMIYQLSCLRDPAAAYGLLAGSTVALIMVSINLKQAQRVLFNRLKVMLEASPYFRETFPARWRILTELRFPKSIWVAPVASNEQNVLGENVFGGALDESNFMPVIEESKRAKGGQQGVYDRAQVLFDAIRRRMLSRFPGMPGRFILLSAEQYPDDFIDRTCRRYQDDPQVMIRQYTQWETRPREQYYSQASFAVEVGTEIRPTRILTGSETGIVGEVIQDVPIELKKEIEDDPEGATRDILGRSTLALTPFITDRQSIWDAVDPERVHPMTDTETTLRDGVAFVWERLCERGRDQDGNEVWHPRWHPERLRYVHIDLGLTNDRAGLAMGCCVGTMEMRRRVPTEDVTKVDYTTEPVPALWYDFLLSVKAPPFEQIQFADIRTVIYELVKHGFRIGKISFDSFGSISEIQILIQKGFDVEKLSVDTSMDPYLFYRAALHERRAKYYAHPVLLRETVQLEYRKVKNKVDHSPQGSKDLADAAAGVAHWVHVLGMEAPPIVMKGLAENAPQEALFDVGDDCAQRGCTNKAIVRGYCREHWEMLEAKRKERLIADPTEQIWSLPEEDGPYGY
jgi:hypothetical protein